MTRHRFPIQNAPTLASIPWSLIAPHEGQALANHQQTLERLAERGGLSACEALLVIRGQSIRALLRESHGPRRTEAGFADRCGCVEELVELAMDHVAEVARNNFYAARVEGDEP